MSKISKLFSIIIMMASFSIHAESSSASLSAFACEESRLEYVSKFRSHIESAKALADSQDVEIEQVFKRVERHLLGSSFGNIYSRLNRLRLNLIRHFNLECADIYFEQVRNPEREMNYLMYGLTCNVRARDVDRLDTPSIKVVWEKQTNAQREVNLSGSYLSIAIASEFETPDERDHIFTVKRELIRPLLGPRLNFGRAKFLTAIKEGVNSESARDTSTLLFGDGELLGQSMSALSAGLLPGFFASWLLHENGGNCSESIGLNQQEIQSLL